MSADHEVAERLTRSRARKIPVLVLLLASQQVTYFSMVNFEAAASGADLLRLAGWLVMSLLLLVYLATGGGIFRRAHVRALLNDETTRAHRASAYSAGFWVAMIFCFLLFGASMYEPVDARTAVHIIMTASIGVALLRFAVLERRALR
jgi:hypothetical protein